MSESSRKGSGKTVSLALGSGGARGMTHIGVIDYLQSQGYEIRCISGASMGALVGGIHATGRLDLFRDWLLSLSKTDVLRYLDLSLSGPALFRGERIIEVLRELIGEHRIEDLPIAFTAVASNIERQREVWLEDGDLFEAIRASIAVPTVFLPHDYRGMHLLDGGLLNPVPVAPTLKTVTDLTVAVNLNALDGHNDSEGEGASASDMDQGILASHRRSIARFLDGLQDNLKPLGLELDLDVDEWELLRTESPGRSGMGLFNLLQNAFETMQNAIAGSQLAAYRPDVLIEIPRRSCRVYEFHRAAEMIELGYRRASEAFARD